MECCGGQWAQRSVGSRFQSPTLCSPTAPVSAPWSRELPSFDDTPTLCSPTAPVSAPWSRELPSFDDTPVLSDKQVGPPVPLLGDPKKKKKKKKNTLRPVRLPHDPVITCKKKKKIVPVRLPSGKNYVDAVSPIRASKARNVGRGDFYVDARKFNPGFSPHALFIPTPKYKSTHDTMPTYRETVFPPEVSDECESMESGYEDNSDVSEDTDSDGPCVVGAEEWLSGLSTCLHNTQKRSVRPKVRAQKDVSSDTAILQALAAKVSLLDV